MQRENKEEGEEPGAALLRSSPNSHLLALLSVYAGPEPAELHLAANLWVVGSHPTSLHSYTLSPLEAPAPVPLNHFPL